MLLKFASVFFSLLFLICSNAVGAQSLETFRILHVMSYHKEWAWNRDQLEGFQNGLGDLNTEIRIVELDTKRNSSAKALDTKLERAWKLLEEWQPDLVYTNDDNAQRHFASKLVGRDVPVVFSGVNRDPSNYDFLGADNVTGVLEHEHFIPTVRLLRKMVPDIRRIAVVVDADPTWKGVMSRIRDRLRDMPDLQIVDWAQIEDFEEYKHRIRRYQNDVDAIALLGVFNFKDESGANVDYQQVLRWTAEHSRVPDFSFWKTRVERGTLGAVAVSGFEQGRVAGTMARRILIEGETPGDIPITSTTTGVPMVNLKRARQLGLSLDAGFLLSVEVIPLYVWDR